MDPSPSTPLPTSEKPSGVPAPYVRIDTLKIKQQLHDVLGENGLPYWQALVSFLTGKIGREELDSLVDGWLGGPEKRLIPLHNHLLISLISNASNALPTAPIPSSAPTSSKRARRPDDPTPYGAKRRVVGWVLGMPKRERERVRASQQSLGEDSEGEDGGEEGLGREARRRGGAGWIGGSEMERERPVLGPANGVEGTRTPTDGGASTPHTPSRQHLSDQQTLPPRTALETRLLPSEAELRDRIARISSENGLEGGAGPGTGKFLGSAIETHLKTLISTHLHLHRSNLLSSPSITTSTSTTSTRKPARINAEASSSTSHPPAPGLIPSTPTPTSPSASSTGPRTPPNTFSLHALQGTFSGGPAGLAVENGSVGRMVGSRLLSEEGWEGMWREAEREKARWAVPDDPAKAEAKEEEKEKEDEPKAEGGAGEGGKKKKKDHAYDYVDPRTILDSILG